MAGTRMVVRRDAGAPVWGYVGPDGDAAARCGTLADKTDAVTLIEPAARTRRRPPGDPALAGGSGRRLAVRAAPADPAEAARVETSLPLSAARSIPIPKTSWNPSTSPVSRFGTARDAMRLIGAGWTDGRIGQVDPDRDGDGVNVVIVDVGFSRAYLEGICPGFRYGGGFVDREPERPAPGAFRDVEGKPGDWHGNMIARNVLRLAPRARLYDAPLLPSRVANVESFTEDAELLFEAIRDAVAGGLRADEPWIIVNAWAVADTIAEWDARGPRYTDDRAHPFNALLIEMSARFDLLFAAGNFGAYAPDPFSGVYDRGNGRSIKGANALPEVLTVGAVTTSGEWIGAASHGYGPAGLAAAGGPNEKPDIAAPAWFGEDADRGLVSSGTSAACGLAAGLLAALRTRRPETPPAEMFDLLRAAAVNRGGEVWNGRTGHGMLRVPG